MCQEKYTFGAPISFYLLSIYFMFRKLFTICTAAFLFVACSSNDDIIPDNETNNANANDASVFPEYARLEFPKLKGGANNRVLIHKSNDGFGVNYCTEWDDSKKSQRWSCYQLYKSNLATGKGVKRYVADRRKGELQYFQDELIPAMYRFAYDPYYRTGYDHGHICPSADRLYTQTANIETFYLSNMQPQSHAFNDGVWKNMETAVRQWGTRNNYGFADTLYVCKGGTIDKNDYILKRLSSGLIVPKYFWMAILRVKDGQYNAIAFWVKHEDNKDTALAKYAISINDLEKKLDIDLFCNLPDDREERIESSVNINLWGLQ